MSAGFSVYNDNGYSQIDENYANLFYVGKGTVTTVANSYGGGAGGGGYTYYTGSATFSATTTTPIVFIRPLTYYSQLLRIVNNGTSLTINVSSQGIETFEYFVFDKMPNDSSGNFGLQVFDANGRITFNSNYKPLRIQTVAKLPDGDLLQQASMNIAAPSNTYAAAVGFRKIATIVGNFYANGTYYTSRLTDSFKISGTGLDTDATIANVIPSSTSVRQDTGGVYMLIKVDGL